MPVDIHFTDDGRGSIIIGRGRVSGQEILDAIDQRFSSPVKVKAYFYGLADYTNVENFNVTNEEIVRIADKDEDASRSNPALILAIAAPDDLVFGLGRMFEMHAHSSGWEIGVFREHTEAVVWIRRKVKERHHCSMTVSLYEQTEFSNHFESPHRQQ